MTRNPRYSEIVRDLHLSANRYWRRITLLYSPRAKDDRKHCIRAGKVYCYQKLYRKHSRMA